MTSSPFQNIALLGATGNLGSNILKALITEGFTVTAIQRKDSPNIAVGASRSLKVDLNSKSELAQAFKDQDVVVSAVPSPTLCDSKIWIEAAIAAGVRRIVPSEFSTNIDVKASQALPIVKDKMEIRRFIEGLAAENKVEWTSVNNGPFFLSFVWISGWIGPNPKTKIAALHDGGEKIVATSTLERISETVAKVLTPEHAEATKNKPIYTYSAAVTERQVTNIVARITGDKFAEEHFSVKELTDDAYAAVEKGDFSKMKNFYFAFCFGDEYRGDFRYQAWNERLGLKVMSEEEVEELVRAWLKETQT